MPSYERINYALRPAKSIERKMLADVFRRLSTFENVSAYRYIGFGSTYFSDFIAFHRALNITDMVSIEKDEQNRERFEFNVPFDCVEMMYGNSTDILPTLAWQSRTIAWLDYDGPLTAEVLADVSFFVANAPSGSVIVISVNANPGDTDAQGEDERHNDASETPEPTRPKTPKRLKEYNSAAAQANRRFQRFKTRVGHAKVPADVSAKDLRKWGVANICKRIITNEINDTLRARNGTLDDDARMSYAPILNFQYADGAKMLTVGGVIYSAGEEPRFREAEFDLMPFVRLDGEAYKIEVPNLTYREIRSLEKQMPCEQGAVLDAPGIPLADVAKYANVYRFFPTFAETDI
jgi:hypothetical protein